MNGQPSIARHPLAGPVATAALVVIALALATLAASAVYDTWFTAEPAPPRVELTGPVAVTPDLEVVKLVAEPLLVYQCLQTRPGEIDDALIAECNEEAEMVVGLLDALADGAS